ncbi:uncharacterized protein M421DRAFT_419616 [Didymella exigua CBS 183.55]|uniref:Uncharacterized protein n=1 Tax=Didymella exigua CBS 183.55 TaxID=1150837 RepID=A0A6A5RQA9_9PLEO|nr:uncharacterized protein M421DRAFT_419616 [Didymella exigua CBS 183.55]KAF1929849.1 hypothetical protein M421DRAFT_419616 [Didymella exigua CBS 183.55]
MPSESASISTGPARPIVSNGNPATIDMPTQRQRREIPHSAEYGETYHIGTCYDEDTLKTWDTDDLRDKPYLAHVKALSRTWRPLRHLADFMQVGTSPLHWRYLHFPENQTELKDRRAKTNVTYIEYKPLKDSQPVPVTIDSADKLKTTLAALSHDPPGAPPLRLFIVEDLSTEVIEQLGSRFDVDPLFFREQIEDNVWYNIRDPWAIAPSLTASTKQRSWFRLRNMRLRYHKTGISYENGRQEVNKWNILRRPDNDNNHWAHKDEVQRDAQGDVLKDNKGNLIGKSVVSIMRTRTTIWIGKDKQCGDGIVGIVLVDPTMEEGKPLWHDRTNWLPTTSMGQGAPPLPTSDRSWYKDIVRTTAAFPWFEAELVHEIGPQVLAYPTLYTVCAEWLIVCDYVKTRVSQIEWEVELPEVFREKEKNDLRSKSELIADSLKRLHTWRRHIPVFRDMVTEALQQALPAAARLTSVSAATEPKAFEDIRPDFDRILDNIKELQDRIDRLTAIVTSEINIEDTKQSIEDNHNLARLTWLATIFIPLSFVSAFFSMNESVSALKYTYGWFFLTAIPFTGICLAVAQLAGGGAWGRKTMGKEIKKQGSSFYSKVKFK